MSIRLISSVVALLLLGGCPQRWDPDDPPGVSRSSASTAGDDEAAVETEVEEVAAVPLDQVHEGELADGDHVLEIDGTLYDELAFTTAAGASVVITMESSDFDPYLHLIGPDGSQLAHMGTPPDEQSGPAELVLVAPESGQYRVYANAVEPQMRGAYRLRVVVEPPPGDAPSATE